MNKILTMIVVAMCLGGAGCDMTPRNYTVEIAKMEDTVFKAFPTVNRVSIEVKGDFGTEIIMTLGDRELYNADEGERQRVTNEAAALTDHIFGEKTPDKGTVVFVEDEQSIVVDEATKKTYPMPLKPKE